MNFDIKLPSVNCLIHFSVVERFGNNLIYKIKMNSDFLSKRTVQVVRNTSWNYDGFQQLKLE